MGILQVLGSLPVFPLVEKDDPLGPFRTRYIHIIPGMLLPKPNYPESYAFVKARKTKLGAMLCQKWDGLIWFSAASYRDLGECLFLRNGAKEKQLKSTLNLVSLSHLKFRPEFSEKCLPAAAVAHSLMCLFLNRVYISVFLYFASQQETTQGFIF